MASKSIRAPDLTLTWLPTISTKTLSASLPLEPGSSEYVKFELASGSVAERVPTTVPAALFSARPEEVSVRSVGASGYRSTKRVPVVGIALTLSAYVSPLYNLLLPALSQIHIPVSAHKPSGAWLGSANVDSYSPVLVLSIACIPLVCTPSGFVMPYSILFIPLPISDALMVIRNEFAILS